jgi:hypothetical protein
MGEGEASAQNLWKKARSVVSPSLDIASGKAGTSIPVSIADDKSIKDELSVAGGDEHVSSDEEPTVEKNTAAKSAVTQLTSSFGKPAEAPTLSYTFAYWIKWKPMETLSDQMLFFGETARISSSRGYRQEVNPNAIDSRIRSTLSQKARYRAHPSPRP